MTTRFDESGAVSWAPFTIVAICIGAVISLCACSIGPAGFDRVTDEEASHVIRALAGGDAGYLSSAHATRISPSEARTLRDRVLGVTNEPMLGAVVATKDATSSVDTVVYSVTSVLRGAGGAIGPRSGALISRSDRIEHSHVVFHQRDGRWLVSDVKRAHLVEVP